MLLSVKVVSISLPFSISASVISSLTPLLFSFLEIEWGLGEGTWESPLHLCCAVVNMGCGGGGERWSQPGRARSRDCRARGRA